MPSARPEDLTQILDERRYHGERVQDQWSVVIDTYQDHKKRVADLDLLYAGDWTLVWPDRTTSDGLPRIPNLIQLGADDRSNLIGSGQPNTVIRPSRESDRKNAEQRERVVGGYWYENRVRETLRVWGFDAIFTGLCVTKVLPDFDRIDEPENMIPQYVRVDPRWCYPDPMWSRGPFVDNMCVSYVEKARSVAERFDATDELLSMKARSKGWADPSQLRVIEFYDGERMVVITVPIVSQAANKPRGEKPFVTLIDTEHRLDKTPVVIGTRATADGVYRGEFDASLALLNTWNRAMSLEIDAAVDRVYPSRFVDPEEVEEWEQWGPDSTLKKKGNKPISESFGFINQPGAPYSNVQLLRMQEGFARTANLIPYSRTGDPNESVISAAGVSATQSSLTDDVRGVQRDVIAPMLAAANEVALCIDERWGEPTGDEKKSISGYARGQSYTEEYRPSKTIHGDYRNRVVFGTMTGLDHINQNVMLLQNSQQKMISMRTAREQSPLVEDPVYEEREIALEVLDQATLAGIVAKAAEGAIDPADLARLKKELRDETATLDEAVEKYLGAPTPMAPPEGPAPLPGAPGIPGAARGQQPQQGQAPLPSLEELGVPR